MTDLRTGETTQNLAPYTAGLRPCRRPEHDNNQPLRLLESLPWPTGAEITVAGRLTSTIYGPNPAAEIRYRMPAVRIRPPRSPWPSA